MFSACGHCCQYCINASTAAEFVLPDQRPYCSLDIPATEQWEIFPKQFFFFFASFAKEQDGVEPSSGNLAKALV